MRGYIHPIIIGLFLGVLIAIAIGINEVNDHLQVLVQYAAESR